MFPLIHPDVSMLAFFQATQLNLFERFLTQAVSGINSTNITAGMQNVAYVVLLIGFLWQVYQAAMHGGDVRGLGVSLVKYVVTAIVVMNYGAIFTTVNQGFVNAGNWISNASGAGNLFENWASDLQAQFNQVGFQKMWGLITGDLPGLLDAILILVAYLLYPIVIVIFGFFYIFYGSVLYIFGPIVIGLMPLGATNRIAKAYVENLCIWNAWPILYGGFGALLSAVQMGQIGQMLNQNNFLGGLGNIEGSILIGIASIVYSLAIAIIPFIARRIVSGDVGATAAALLGAAATAVTVGAAAAEGAVAGVTSSGAGAGAEASTSGSTGGATAGSARAVTMPMGSNQPGRPQQAPTISELSVASQGGATLENHAQAIRNSLSRVIGGGDEGRSEGRLAVLASNGGSHAASSSGAKSGSGTKFSGSARTGPSVHRYNLGTWGAYHAARLTAHGMARAMRTPAGADEE